MRGPAVSRALAEKKLRDENKRSERERWVLETQLRQAQRMEAVGLLASGVAHDFNNIITVVCGQCDLVLSRGKLEQCDRERLEEIDRAANRASSLTRQLSAFSRRQVLQPTVLDLNTVLNDTNRMLVRVIGEDIVVETELAADLGHVKADRGQLEQVVMNLALNARDAMPRGGKLTLRTSNVDVDRSFASARDGLAPGRYVMLSVSDRGEGMDEEMLDRIFEPFYTTKELGRGTGLGLSTVYGIVRQSNGFIYVSSERSVGTTFEILLPRVDEPLTVICDEPRTRTRGAGGKIYLVEDDFAIRKLMREFLESGFRVRELSHALPKLLGPLAHEVLEIEPSFRQARERVVERALVEPRDESEQPPEHVDAETRVRASARTTRIARSAEFKPAIANGARGSTRAPANRMTSPIIISAGTSVWSARSSPISRANIRKIANSPRSTRRVKSAHAARVWPRPMRTRTITNVATVVVMMTLISRSWSGLSASATAASMPVPSHPQLSSLRNRRRRESSPASTSSSEPPSASREPPTAPSSNERSCRGSDMRLRSRVESNASSASIYFCGA